MAHGARGELTNLLVEWGKGSQPALDRLLPHVYDELRTLARSYLRRERPGHTVQTGTLVHEAFVRLIEGHQVSWESRAHFFGIAARLMRQILVDHARRRNRTKRGGGIALLPLHDPETDAALARATSGEPLDVVALDEALTQLAAVDPRKSRVVELRFFGALTVQETAVVLAVSPATVMNDWAFARAWLYRALGQG